MKFLLRSLLVLAVAAAVGIILYFAVQALPGGPQTSPGARVEPPAAGNAPQNLPPRQERPENDRGSGFRPRALLGVAGKAILFSVLVTVSVLAKNFIFERKAKQKNSPD
jgi:hypothetical protein